MSIESFIVVGGGLSGFTAAIELASAGHKVTLCEQSARFGGRASTHHQQGYAMNIGPHGFYRAGVMKQQFDAWGIAYSGKVPVTGAAAYLLSNGERHRFPTNAVNLLRSRFFSFRDRIRIGQALQKLQKTDPDSHCGQSMQSWIESNAGSPAAASLLAALTRVSTYSADLSLLDARAAITQLQLAFAKSVLYLDGGWETLIASLARKAQSMGVELRAESGVTKVYPGAIELRAGERLAADGIVLAIPPNEAEHLTGRKLPPRTPARAACLDLGLKRLPPRSASFALGLDEPAYFSVHSLYASRLAPENGALVQIAKYLDRGSSGTREELERVADVAMPGWRDEVVLSRFLPEMTVVHAIPEAGRGRPDIDALKMPRVMIAGDWVGPQSMLADAAVASGLRAARALGVSAAGKAA
jgi:phytoene dehydrogenase-like protein